MQTRLPKTSKILLLFSLWALLAVSLSACGVTAAPTATVTPTNTSTPTIPPSATPKGAVPTYTYRVVQRWPHDTSAFTEGLAFADGKLYESDGLNGKSSVRIVELQTGSIEKKVDLAAEYFGEGLALLGGKLYQLTWKNQKGFVYDEGSLEKTGEFSYQGQGWGLAQDGSSLVMSNGSNVIAFIDPQTFRVQRTIRVFDRGIPVVNINELEFIKGEIYANVWLTDRIARIDPVSGDILGWIDLSGLRPAETLKDKEAVLNGIAYDAANERLFITGKRWPTLFEIKLEDKPAR